MGMPQNEQGDQALKHMLALVCEYFYYSTLL